MKILVTGATGFLGNHVIEELLRRDVEVVATSSHLPQQPAPWFPAVVYLPFDILKAADFVAGGNSLMSYFGQPDKIIHLAWRNSSRHQQPEHFEVELPAQYTFLRAFVDEGMKDITVTGTSFEYGLKNNEVSEHETPAPNTFYGLAKYSLLKALELYKTKKPFLLKWVRLFNIYGSGTQENTLLSQLDAAIRDGHEHFNMSGGEQVRDFLSVKRATEYLATISLQYPADGVINCCSADPKSVKTFVEEYLKQTNQTIKLNLGHYPYRDYEPMAIWGNNEKLLKILS